MEESPVTVYQAGDVGEAQLVRGLLLEEGINAKILGESQPFAGLSAAMSVDVVVPEQDRIRALEIVAKYQDDQSEVPETAEWTCPKCAETSPATFEICFKCGAGRPATQAAENSTREASTSTSKTDFVPEQNSEGPESDGLRTPQETRGIWPESLSENAGQQSMLRRVITGVTVIGTIALIALIAVVIFESYTSTTTIEVKGEKGRAFLARFILDDEIYKKSGTLPATFSFTSDNIEFFVVPTKLHERDAPISVIIWQDEIERNQSEGHFGVEGESVRASNRIWSRSLTPGGREAAMMMYRIDTTALSGIFPSLLSFRQAVPDRINRVTGFCSKSA